MPLIHNFTAVIIFYFFIKGKSLTKQFRVQPHTYLIPLFLFFEEILLIPFNKLSCKSATALIPKFFFFLGKAEIKFCRTQACQIFLQHSFKVRILNFTKSIGMQLLLKKRKKRGMKEKKKK